MNTLNLHLLASESSDTQFFSSDESAVTSEQLQSFLNASGGLCFGLDGKGRITFVSETTCHVLGYPQNYVIGQHLSSLVSGGQEAEMAELLHSAHQRVEGGRGVIKIMLGSSEERWFEFVLKPSLRADGPFFVAFGYDVSKWKHESTTLEQKYLFDPLTGTGNRIVMKSAIEQGLVNARDRGQIFAVALLDLDGFKKINDTFGHDVGDALLQGVAKRLKQNIRGSDIIIRMGGDEFVILINEITGQQEGMALSERLVKSFKQPFQIGNLQLRVTTSLGIAFSDMHMDEAELLKRADLAMYEAKSKGKNQLSVYSEDLGQRVKAQVDTEQRMYSAVQEGEFLLQYQPIFCPGSKAVHGVEALMRWDKPGGKVSPDFFIPLAEQNGLIHLLGQWAIRSSCAQLLKWEKEGCHVPSISVNISPVQLTHPRFVENVKSSVTSVGLNPSRLVLEITEGALMADPVHSEKILKDLREFGVNFAVDDFGTGYSSLSYLKKFPLQSLKIDRSFISDMLDSNQSKTIVSAVISIAKALGLKVVAEGVETAEQSSALVEQGCTFAQGWLIAPALHPDDFVNKVQAGGLRLACPVAA